MQPKAIITAHLPTCFHVADIFTKALGKDRFHFLLNKLSVHNIQAPT